MLNFAPNLKIFLAIAPSDMRKSHDGLAALVEQVLLADPLSGRLFVFRNRQADRIKLLYWDGDGDALWYKRLEKGGFRFPAAAADATPTTISAADLTMLLAGIDLASVRRHPRFQLPEKQFTNNLSPT